MWHSVLVPMPFKNFELDGSQAMSPAAAITGSSATAMLVPSAAQARMTTSARRAAAMRGLDLMNAYLPGSLPAPLAARDRRAAAGERNGEFLPGPALPGGHFCAVGNLTGTEVRICPVRRGFFSLAAGAEGRDTGPTGRDARRFQMRRRSKPITNIDDPRYVKALAHPMRIRVLAMLE